MKISVQKLNLSNGVALLSFLNEIYVFIFFRNSKHKENVNKKKSNCVEQLSICVASGLKKPVLRSGDLISSSFNSKFGVLDNSIEVGSLCAKRKFTDILD